MRSSGSVEYMTSIPCLEIKSRRLMGDLRFKHGSIKAEHQIEAMLRCGWGHVNAIRKKAVAHYCDSLFERSAAGKNPRIFAARAVLASGHRSFARTAITLGSII